MQTMQAAETTKVIYGVNGSAHSAGKTVRGIWKVLEQVFNIPRDAVVNGTWAVTTSSFTRATRSSSRRQLAREGSGDL